MGGKNEGLESASLFILSGDPILPATITFVTVPDYEYSGSGEISLGGSSDYFVGITKGIESSWSILGEFESGFLSEWNIGEGEYYWYRVEGSCGELRCDTAGIVYGECQNMTFMTIVGARNLTELCTNLANPVLNPRVDFKLSSIKKYSRPFLRSDSDLCNTLEEQEFCNIAECLDYCIDQDVVEKISFSMRAIEATIIVEMSGGFSLFGQVQTDRNKYYEPEFPVIGISGNSQSLVAITHSPSSSPLTLSGLSETKSSSYDFNGSGILLIGGYARTVSPNRKYSEMEGGVEIYGDSRLNYAPLPSGGIEFSGSAETFFSMDFAFSGKLELGGRLLEYTSPVFFVEGSGSIVVDGESSFNFSDYGTAPFDFGFSMRAFDFASETSELTYESRLTISDQVVSPSCGCGPVALSLSLKHNLSNSAYLSAFMKRAGLQMGDFVTLRYASSEVAWRSNQYFLGRGRDGVSLEDLNISFDFSCSDSTWGLSFYAKSFNRSSGDELYTKFIVDIPADIICLDGSISTAIELDINSGTFQSYLGESVNVVTPGRSFPSNPGRRIIDVFVDGTFVQNRIYYDGIGMFKNSYWNDNFLRMTINTPSSTKMPGMEIHRIFS